MKTRILTSKIICFQLLNRVNSIRGDHMLLVINSCKLFQHIQKKGRGCTKQIRGLTCDNPSVLQLHGSSRSTSFFLSFQGSRNNLAVLQCGMCLLQKKLDLVNLLLCAGTGHKRIHTLVISADDLLTGSLLANLIIHNTVSCHINAHICRRFVWALAHDFLKHSLYNRENLYVTVIVDSGLTISFQMEWVDHVDIIQISGSCLISQVYRVLQRDIPDWESLELGIACADSSLVFMIKLGKTGSHFSASRSRRCDNNQRAGGFDIVILAVSLVTYDQGSIAWITWDIIKDINLDSKLLQTLLERISTVLSGVTCDADASYIKSSACKFVHQTEHVLIICDAKVTADLILFNIRCTDYDYDLCLVGKLHQHAQLAVWLKSWKNTGSVVVIK